MKKFNNPIHLPSNNVIPTKPKQILNTKKPFKTTYPKRYKNQYQRRIKKVIPVYNRTIVNDKLLFHEKNQLIPNAMTASTTDIVSVKSPRNNQSNQLLNDNLSTFLNIRLEIPKNLNQNNANKFLKHKVDYNRLLNKTKEEINQRKKRGVNTRSKKQNDKHINAVNNIDNNINIAESNLLNDEPNSKTNKNIDDDDDNDDDKTISHNRIEQTTESSRNKFFDNYKIARKKTVIGGFVKELVTTNPTKNETKDDIITKKYLHNFLDRIIEKTVNQSSQKKNTKNSAAEMLKKAQISFHDTLVAQKVAPIPLKVIVQQSSRLSHVLTVDGTHIGLARAKAFADWLLNLPSNTIGVINLTNSGCGATGLVHILDAILCNHLYSVESLILTGNKVNKMSLLYIIRILTWKRLLNCPISLHNIDLSCSHMNDYLGLQFLRAMINCKHTETLRLRRCNLGKESAIMLAEIIAYSSTLKTLDVRDNNLRGEGAMAIALALRVNKSLRVVELGFNSFGSSYVGVYSAFNSESWVCSNTDENNVPEEIHEHGVCDFAIVVGLLCEAINIASKHLKVEEIINCLIGKATLKSVPMQLFPVKMSRQDALSLLPRRVIFFGQGCSHSYKYWMSLFNMIRQQTSDQYIEMITVSCDVNRKGVPHDSEDVYTSEQRPAIGVSGRALV